MREESVESLMSMDFHSSEFSECPIHTRFQPFVLCRRSGLTAVIDAVLEVFSFPVQHSGQSAIILPLRISQIVLKCKEDIVKVVFASGDGAKIALSSMVSWRNALFRMIPVSIRQSMLWNAFSKDFFVPIVSASDVLSVAISESFVPCDWLDSVGMELEQRETSTRVDDGELLQFISQELFEFDSIATAAAHSRSDGKPFYCSGVRKGRSCRFELYFSISRYEVGYKCISCGVEYQCSIIQFTHARAVISVTSSGCVFFSSSGVQCKQECQLGVFMGPSLSRRQAYLQPLHSDSTAAFPWLASYPYVWNADLQHMHPIHIKPGGDDVITSGFSDIMGSVGTIFEVALRSSGPKLLGIHSPMGSGKTTLLKQLMKQVDSTMKRVVVVTARVSLAIKLWGTLQSYSFVFYKASQSNALEHDRMVVQLESLNRKVRPGAFFDPVDAYDLVILDEFVSLMAQFNSPTMNGKVGSTLDTLCDVCRSAKLVICMDADLIDDRFDWFRREVMQLQPGHARLIINSHQSLVGYRADVIPAIDWRSALHTSLQKGERCVVVCSTKRQARALSSELERRHIVDPKTILVYDSATADDDKDSLSDPHLKNWDDPIRVVFYTSSVGIGIDKSTGTTFDRVFLALSPGGPYPRMLFQMLRRVRKPRVKQFLIAALDTADVGESVSPIYLPTTLHDVTLRLNEYRKHVNSHAGKVLECDTGSSSNPFTEYMFQQLCAMNLVEHNIKQKKALGMLLEILFKQGCKCSAATVSVENCSPAVEMEIDTFSSINAKIRGIETALKAIIGGQQHLDQTLMQAASAFKQYLSPDASLLPLASVLGGDWVYRVHCFVFLLHYSQTSADPPFLERYVHEGNCLHPSSVGKYTAAMLKLMKLKLHPSAYAKRSQIEKQLIEKDEGASRGRPTPLYHHLQSQFALMGVTAGKGEHWWRFCRRVVNISGLELVKMHHPYQKPNAKKQLGIQLADVPYHIMSTLVSKVGFDDDVIKLLDQSYCFAPLFGTLENANEWKKGKKGMIPGEAMFIGKKVSHVDRKDTLFTWLFG